MWDSFHLKNKRLKGRIAHLYVKNLLTSFSRFFPQSGTTVVVRKACWKFALEKYRSVCAFFFNK